MPRHPAPKPANKWGLPHLGYGIGLRTVHFPHILTQWPAIDWFEVLSENYMATGGRPLHVLRQVAARYPVALHGVSLNIGSTDPLNRPYLAELKNLAEQTQAHWISDHLCFTGVSGLNTHDLLPMPYTRDALRHSIARVKQVQDILERPIALENPSTYLAFTESTIPEHEFLIELADRADCALLVDVNNIYVSSFNHGFDPATYIDAVPAHRIVQVHLAGHTHKGTHILDTHSTQVIDEVWQLYSRLIQRTGPLTTLLEWDEDIPAFDIVHAEALKARQFASLADAA